MIAAVLSICLQANPAQCAVQHFRIEADACHLGSYRAEAPAGGEWRAVIVRVKCLGHAAPERRHSRGGSSTAGRLLAPPEPGAEGRIDA